ncbi:ParA family protein [Leptolyngbya sp. FACHB-321]|uniref:ParA family protein n=1 Tax=Leptolyngbya sp. FACHB-321 TaxID=2692807 RepID=UPI001683FFE9|nr:ParA family protein [Leptolyngbya sp. FACHB-321]MBD2034029.1 ParA family protein [Leptolyngbya sp. FACHB-321]
MRSYKKLVDLWSELPTDYREQDLEMSFVQPLLQSLDLNLQQIKAGRNLGAGFGTPDRLIYQDINQPPVLVIENKKRDPGLAAVPEKDFASVCKTHPLYRQAVGYEDCGRSNKGIKQYLDSSIPSALLASYGLVFNGDFFQLWRRVDGLVLPMTPIQKVTKASLPGLMRQLEYCLANPTTALVSAIWNQKGGVAKTTNIVNIGATLALEGKRVLLIDLDPQNDLTRGVGADPNWFPGYLEQCDKPLQLEEWDEAKQILNKAIQIRKFPTTDKVKKDFKLSVLSSDEKSLKAFRDNSDVEPAVTFKKLVRLLYLDYDYIFIDVSPTPDKLTQSVLLACDTVLIPIDLGGKSLHHAVQLYGSTIPKFRELRAAKKERLHLGPWNLGIVFSNCPGDAGVVLETHIKQVLEKSNFSGNQCKTRLSTFAQTKVAEFKHVPVICWQSSPITKLYTKLVDELFLTPNFIDH